MRGAKPRFCLGASAFDEASSDVLLSLYLNTNFKYPFCLLILKYRGEMKSKRAQTAIEFIVIFSAVLFFFIAFFAVVQSDVEEKNLEKKRILAQSIGTDVRDEISLAVGSSEGYYREFYVPQNIIGYEYEINITEKRIYISAEKIRVSYKIPEISGQIKKGVNNITKQNGTVSLN